MKPRFLCLDLRAPTVREMPAPPTASILCLGNFDGVHVAHRALLQEGLRLRDARLPDGLCGVFCFFRPSIDYLSRPDAPSPRTSHLTSLGEKLRLFADIGIDFVCLADFPTVRDDTPEAFLDELCFATNCRGAVCGYNFRFGKGGAGNSETLCTYFDKSHLRGASVVPEITVDGAAVSASRIRACLNVGDVRTATALLGRPYALDTPVVHGKRLGRTIGFPTANQYFPPERIIPAYGVYATRCHTPYGVSTGVSNVGEHPTVDAHARVNCETYILGLSHNLYGKSIRVEFLEYLRPERRFANIDELTAAIRRDADAARRLLDGE